MPPYSSKSGNVLKTGVYERTSQSIDSNKALHENHISSADHSHVADGSGTPDNQRDNEPHLHVERDEKEGTEGDTLGVDQD